MEGNDLQEAKTPKVSESKILLHFAIFPIFARGHFPPPTLLSHLRFLWLFIPSITPQFLILNWRPRAPLHCEARFVDFS